MNDIENNLIIKSLRKRDYQPNQNSTSILIQILQITSLDIIKDGLIEIDALNLEKEFVKEYGNVYNHTGTLFNFTNGGEGYSGGMREKRSATQETKEKCRIASTGRKMSEETKRKMSEKKQNIKGTRRTPVIIYGIRYESVSDAAIAIGWHLAKLSKHLSSGYYEEFKYVDEDKMRLSVASRKNRRKGKGILSNDLQILNNHKENIETIINEKQNKITILEKEISELFERNISEKLSDELDLIRNEYNEFINYTYPD